MKKTLLILTLVVSVCHAQNSKEVKSYFKPAIKPFEVTREVIKDSVFVGNDADIPTGIQLYHKAFCNDTYFNTTFSKPAQFYGSIFYKDAVFTGSKFKDLVDFSGVTFFRDITFSICIFNKTIFMSGIRADSIAVFNFYRATLPDLIDFSHNKTLHHIVDFTDADFDSVKREKIGSSDTRHFINIYDSDINKLKLDYLHFRLCFYDPSEHDMSLTNYFNGLKIAYEKHQKNTDEKQNLEDAIITKQLTTSSIYEQYMETVFPSVRLDDPLIKDFTRFYFLKGWFPSRLSRDQTEALYSRLLKNFDANGQKMSYKSADIDRNNFISTYWNISRYWNRYGYNKEWIFYWTVGFLLLFTIITYLLGNVLFEHRNENDVVYDVKKMPVLTQPLKYPSLKKIKYAFIYTSIIFFSFSLKTENLNFQRNAFFYIVIINVVGLLCLGYLANFILQK